MRGFIALVSSLIISSVLLAAMMGISMASLYARAEALDEDAAAGAREALRGCIEDVRLRLATEPAFGGGISLGIGVHACVVSSISRDEDALSFVASVSEGTALAQVTASVSAADFSLRVVPNVPP